MIEIIEFIRPLLFLRYRYCLCFAENYTERLAAGAALKSAGFDPVLRAHHLCLQAFFALCLHFMRASGKIRNVLYFLPVFPAESQKKERGHGLAPLNFFLFLCHYGDFPYAV